MSISNEVVRAIYTGNGVTTSFAIPHDIVYTDATADEIEVYTVDETTTPVETLRPNGATADGWQVSGANINFVTAPVSGHKVVVQRKITLTQPTDLDENGDFPAEEVETTLDRLCAEIQLINLRLRRTLKTRLSIPDADLDLTLTDPSALKYLRWASDEGGVEAAFINANEVTVDLPTDTSETDVLGALAELYGLLAGTVSDTFKLKISGTDTDEDYLSQKLVAGPNITLEVVDPGANEKIRITGEAGGGATSHLDLTDIGTNTHDDIDTHIADTSIHLSSLASFDTGDLAEGLNLYFTDARAQAAVGLIPTTAFSVANNQTNANVTGLTVDGATYSQMVVDLNIRRTDATPIDRMASYQLILFFHNGAWVINNGPIYASDGTTPQVTFSVQTTGTVGQVRYTSSNYTGGSYTGSMNYSARRI